MCIFITCFHAASYSTVYAGDMHPTCTNDNIYTSGNTSTPGIIAGAVGGVVTILILVALIIGCLTYSWYAHRISSNLREIHNDDIASVSEPPPYQPPLTMEHISARSTCSSKNASTLFDDPPPNYSSLL